MPTSDRESRFRSGSDVATISVLCSSQSQQRKAKCRIRLLGCIATKSTPNPDPRNRHLVMLKCFRDLLVASECAIQLDVSRSIVKSWISIRLTDELPFRPETILRMTSKRLESFPQSRRSLLRCVFSCKTSDMHLAASASINLQSTSMSTRLESSFSSRRNIRPMLSSRLQLPDEEDPSWVLIVEEDERPVEHDASSSSISLICSIKFCAR